MRRGQSPDMDGEEAAAAAAESWYQLPAVEDASVAMPTLSETVARGEYTDFPSLEEGTLLSETELRKGFFVGQTHLSQLEVQDSRLSPRLHLLATVSTPEIQDSRLSPHLPLMTADSTSGHKFFEDTLFQKTEVDDFAPLRASLDMSQFPRLPLESLQMSDAVELASKEVAMDQGESSVFISQNYLRTAQEDMEVGGGLQSLSQHPLSFSHGEKDYKGNEPKSAVSTVASSDNINPLIIDKDLTSEDGAFLRSSVPAPVLLELLEKEVGMSSSSGRSSRRSSKSSGSENVPGSKHQEPDPEPKNLITLDSGLSIDPKTASNQSLEESFRDSSQVDFLKDLQKETEDPNELSHLNQSGITLRQMKPPSLMDTLHKQLCSEIQQRYKEQDTKIRKETTSPQSSLVFNKTCTESPSNVEDTKGDAPLREELSMSSRCSIERGHKDTEMSQAGNTPVDEASFIGRLAHPISQSTPGTFTMNRKPLSGRIQQIKAKLTGSDMSLNEEPSTESSPHNVAQSALPQSVQSSQGYPESSDSQRSLSPQRRRIQSLPSLNYIEKVGAWNTNQSFDALVLRGITGTSPKKLAYNAVADSLNRMLSSQASATNPKKGLSASFKATSSMTNLSTAEKESSTTSQITRSQSYNSVLPREDQAEEVVRPSEVHETTISATAQSQVSSGSSTTRDNASKWVESNTMGSSVGGQDHPVTKTPSELKDSLHSGRREGFDTSENQNRNLVTMDQFSDVSLDQDYANSSNSSNREKEMLLASLTSAKHDLTREGGEDNWSPTRETPGKEELDIEERIPTYLKNLGIDQSPTTILTPFAPRGPIREPEFSPSELRTIKGSTATPSRSMRLSEGGSQSAVNISQSSLYSSTSTTSVSIPMGSEAGPESPLPTELSPPFGPRSADDRPISQDDTMTRGVGRDLATLSDHVAMSPAVKPIHDLNLSEVPSQAFLDEDLVKSTGVKQIIEQFETGGYDGTTPRHIIQEQASSLQGFSMRPPIVDPINDSFIGSKTLKEIQKLLAEGVSLDRTGSGLHRASPVGDPYTESPSRSLNLEDSLKSLNSRSASPLDLLVKDMSWDSSFNSGLTGDHLVNKDLAGTWNTDSLNTGSSSYLELSVNTFAAPVSHWRRSEPEGCSKATTNKVMPSSVKFQDAIGRGEREFVDVAERVQRSEQLLSNVSSSVGGLKNTLAVTGSVYARGRDTESDESSGDSLAARVTSLLRNETPLTHTVRVTQSADEEERRARGSVKLKLTSHPMMAEDTELSEEDRRRIEEIKKELLDKAKEAEKDYSRLASSREAREFRLRLTPSPFQLPVTSSHEDTQDIPSHVHHYTTSGGMTKDSSDHPPPTPHSCQQDPTAALGENAHELERQSMSPTVEATKPISSITFSSRKRSSPLSASLDGGSEPLPSRLQDVFDKSPDNQGFDHKSPSVLPLSHEIYHIHHQDLADKESFPTSGACTTQEFPSSSWVVDEGYSEAASIQQTSAPSVKRYGTWSFTPKENVDPGCESVNPEGSLVMDHSHRVKSSGSDDRQRPYCGPDNCEDSAEGSLLTKQTLSSPTRKALSCIHVTISPKEDMKVLDVTTALVTVDPERGSSAMEARANLDKSRSSSAHLPEKVLSLNNLSARTVPLSSPHPTEDNKATHKDFSQFMDKENLPTKWIQSERRRSPLSDATTQITTESPEKTTFSAEIFVEGSLREASTPSILKVNHTPEQQTSPKTSLSYLSRATDQPLLLPYRPPGSPELFYVPFMEGGSRMSPVSTIESSHTGSNDAVSPNFHPDILGSTTEKLSDLNIPRHREGIYTKEPSPKTSERKPQMARGSTGDHKSADHPLKSAYSPLQDSRILSKMSHSTIRPSSPESTKRSISGGLRSDLAFSLGDEEFLPLQPEIDYCQVQPDMHTPLRALEVTERKKTYKDVPSQTHGKPSGSADSSLQRSFSRSRAISRAGSSGQSVISNQSLDDLWARYTERKRRTPESSSKLEVSLVERLERLARLLQNPQPHSLMVSTDKEENHQEIKKAAREQWYRRKLGVDSPEDDFVSKPYEGSDNSSLHSEVRSTVTDSATVTTESLVGSDVSSGTGGSTSVSTIDTIRLINAFGPEKVIPSSRLRRLYSTIDMQKKRTEETVRGSKRGPAGRGQPRMEIQELLKSHSKMADVESVASADSLWEPSPALRPKNGSKGLSKGVQAGELEIVMSATRKNTRDVGTTFPSPGGERLKSVAANMEANVRTSNSKVKAAVPYIPAGLSWFVPAENLKSESRKENEPRVGRGPGPAWYEPVKSTKPWREPLREKNEQDRGTSRHDQIHGTRVTVDKTLKPFIRVTLQESLRSHRPDFIFRSGERVKRLQLLAEERKLQSVFQGERDVLFNHQPRSRAPQYKDSRSLQQSRSIPKKEMIQRSKRIYEQLPEIRKRKEEEKRRSEYDSYRVRAQLFRKKVTNRILGRKTPWN
ncbi:centrosome-associated protein ALMS1 isoform X2 [Hyla sarda]|uniref:centrosome-associated protein ALMS1 isoform X2 n=1 Tax=Hyla sarda TaxID=327740 RepID=UPI0024C45EDC|nr:centrosome-associated protein ALMS1 isoform X2 [Hyla sarda]